MSTDRRQLDEDAARILREAARKAAREAADAAERGEI